MPDHARVFPASVHSAPASPLERTEDIVERKVEMTVELTPCRSVSPVLAGAVMAGVMMASVVLASVVPRRLRCPSRVVPCRRLAHPA